MRPILPPPRIEPEAALLEARCGLGNRRHRLWLLLLDPGQHARHPRGSPGATACRLNAALVERFGEPAQRRGASLPQLGYDRRQVTVQMAGVTVHQDDYVIADRCGSVFVPAPRIEEVLDLGERIARRQEGMVAAVRAGRSVAEVMHDKEFEAIRKA
jgi:hypothetical protein